MSPEIRAAADGFIYDGAMLIHVADSLGEGELGRVCPATGWTLRQTLGHVTASYERYAGSLERRVAGAYAPWQPVPSAETALAEANTAVPDIQRRIREARARILRGLEGLTPSMESGPLAEGFPAVREVAKSWSRHGTNHAIDFVETVPGLAADPLILGWLMYPWPGEDASLDERRRKLIQSLKSSRKEPRQ